MRRARLCAYAQTLNVLPFLYVHDSMTSVTVRIPDDLKREMEALGVKVSEVTRSALENEVKRLRRKKAKEAAEKLGNMLADVPDEVIMKVMRESRDER
jgi:post-segregation antitoxin (ccd killing protein)